MHGVNLDQLGRRPASHYGDLTFEQLEFRIDEFGAELDLALRFFQTNAEHEFVEEPHRRESRCRMACCSTPARGRTTPTRSATRSRSRRCRRSRCTFPRSRRARSSGATSVISDLCIATVSGQGVEGYREALARLKKELGA